MNTPRVSAPLSDCEPWLDLRAAASGPTSRSERLFSAGTSGPTSHCQHWRRASLNTSWSLCTSGCRAGLMTTACSFLAAERATTEFA